MNGFCNRIRIRILFLSLAPALLAVLLNPAPAIATDIVRVEEDWEMVVGVPSTTSDAPQVTCLISPVGNIDGIHATFVVNHHDTPTFAAGGLQLQAWDGETQLANKRFPNQAMLATQGETIRWTQAMSVGTEGLVFEVINGESTTWGQFGGEGTLKVTLQTSLANLNGYSPDLSARESGVSYAGNRVQSLVLKRIRSYTAPNTFTGDDNPRVVHSLEQ